MWKLLYILQVAIFLEFCSRVVFVTTVDVYRIWISVFKIWLDLALAGFTSVELAGAETGFGKNNCTYILTYHIIVKPSHRSKDKPKLVALLLAENSRRVLQLW